MKSQLKRKFFLITFLFVACGSLLTFIFVDIFNDTHFRSSQTALTNKQNVNLAGLYELKASGSGPISFSNLKSRLEFVRDPIVIVDAMAELHGYIQGTPTIFFGYQRHSPNFKHSLRRLFFTGTNKIRHDLITPEEEEAKKYGFGFQKVTIGSKFIAKDEHIDEIVRFFDSLPQNIWVHFHCAQGKGRTSMLLVMYDIMKNAPFVPLQDIIKRHIMLGSEDLFNLDVWKKSTYSEQQLKNRKEFLVKFYNFVCQRKKGGLQIWSNWNRDQH